VTKATPGPPTRPPAGPPSPAADSVTPLTAQPTAQPPTRPNGGGGPVELADRVADATRSVPGVTDLHTGTFGEVATYLPGRRVSGVRVLDDRCEVHIVVAWGDSVLQVAQQVQNVVALMVGTPVDVTVEDVVDVSSPAPPSAPSQPASPNAGTPGDPVSSDVLKETS